MAKETEGKVTEDKRPSLECGPDDVVWSAAPEFIEDDEREEDADDLTGEEIAEALAADRFLQENAVIINRNQYSAVVRSRQKIVICCPDVKIVLEGGDELMEEIAECMARALKYPSENDPLVLRLPDAVRMSLA